MQKDSMGYRHRDMPEMAEGQVVAYARKSQDDKSATKSIKDQHAINVKTAERLGLPLSEGCLKSEKPGHGGDEFWIGGGSSGIEGDTHSSQKTRPVLTEVMKGIVEGRIKCVVVWSLCRLWRDVAICETMIKVLSKHGCMLCDRNGPVDISTPDGRTAVRSNAVAAQNMREYAVDAAPRGIATARDSGKLVVGANRLGFRSVGGTSGGVVHVPEEQELVRQLFREFDRGRSVDQICRRLTDEGYQWMTDVNKPNKPKGTATTAVHRQVIRDLLRDCRYQGRQPYTGEEYPCDAFLVDGVPVVPEALFERVQAKLKAARRGSPGQTKSHPLAGVVRCGLCGQSMRQHKITQRLAGGRAATWHVWLTLHYPVESWCTHRLPVVEVADLDGYIPLVLAPLLSAELRERAAGSHLSVLADRKAVLTRQIQQTEWRLKEELPREWEENKITMQMLGDLERRLKSKLLEMKGELRDVEERAAEDERKALAVENIAGMDAGMRKDALRAVVRWIAVIPSDVTRTRDRKSDDTWRSAEDAGRVVFLTAWGTLHTAFIERVSRQNYHRRSKVCQLRPATAQEAIGTVGDFPDPAAFVAGLARAHKNGRYDFAPQEVAPGYSPGEDAPTAEFSLAEFSL